MVDAILSGYELVVVNYVRAAAFQVNYAFDNSVRNYAKRRF